MTCRELNFICTNKECEINGQERMVYAWSDREKNPDCVHCGQELAFIMIKSYDNIRSDVAPAQLKFAGMSVGEKREIMKKRSSDHFHKNIKESWIEKNRP